MEQNKKERVYWIDNLRAFLIICVVFGHLIETLSFPGRDFLYIFLYSFHMPAMVFLSGLCAKDKVNIKGIIKKMILPYVVFQILLFLIYFLFDNDSKFSLLTPGWIMWYLMSLAFWSLIIPFFKTESKKKKFIFLFLSVLISLLIGFVDQVGTFLSLSRTIVFFPFFLSGFYMKERGWERGKRKKRLLIPIIIFALFSILLIALFCENIKWKWMYHSCSYVEASSIIMRTIILAIASVFVCILYFVTPNKKIPYISYLGRNTMPVYLLHGIFIRIFREYQNIFLFVNPLFLSILLTIVIVLLCANPFMEKVWNYIFEKRPYKESA